MTADGASRWVRCRIDPAAEDAVAELAGEVGALGVQLEPAGELVLATVHVPLGGGGLDEVADRLAALAFDRAVEQGEQPAADWLERYREHVRPFPVGDTWWIDPHPGSPTAAPGGRAALVLEPRMAFGTGSHESTQLLLLWLERQLLEGRSVLDVGTGSGVLSLAACVRGARWALGLDVDLQAVLVARQIVRAQERELPVRLLAGPAAAVAGSFDVVLCNMVPESTLPLLGELERCLAPGGRVALSGLLAEQRDEVEEALRRRGLVARRSWALGEWIGLEADRG